MPDQSSSDVQCGSFVFRNRPEKTMQNRRYRMKRMMAIVLTLCLLVLATVGNGAAAAPQKLPPPYRVVQFDVTYHDETAGRLVVNTNEMTYVLNAHGLEPGTEYYFYCLGKFPQISRGTTNENGDLHLAGAWREDIDIVMQTPEFVVTDRPLVGGSYCVTPKLTAKCYAGLVRIIIWGTLSIYDGTPLPDQRLWFEWYEKKTDNWWVFEERFTGADGAYKLTALPTFYAPMVSYPGGEYNGVPYCDVWEICTYSASVPI
jgi:hypothetical protein